MAKQPTAAEIRRLDRALGVERSGRGLLLALLAIGALAIMATPFALSTGPAVEAYGRVVTLGSVRKGSSPSVQVAVGDKSIWLKVSYRFECSVGDRIQVYRHTTAFGPARYRLGPRGCIRRA